MQHFLRLIARPIYCCKTYVRHCKENAPIYMYYVAPETPISYRRLFRPRAPPIFWTSGLLFKKQSAFATSGFNYWKYSNLTVDHENGVEYLKCMTAYLVRHKEAACMCRFIRSTSQNSTLRAGVLAQSVHTSGLCHSIQIGPTSTCLI